MRRLLRRAILDGQELGITEPFMATIANAVIQQMKVGYPELIQRQETALRVIVEEEKQFGRTLRDGRGILDEQMKFSAWHQVLTDDKSKLASVFETLKKHQRYLHIGQRGNGLLEIKVPQAVVENLPEYPTEKHYDEIDRRQKEIIPKLPELLDEEWARVKPKLASRNHGIQLVGSITFALWDTYGIPIEIVKEQAHLLGFGVDEEDFKIALQLAVKRSQAGSAMSKEIFASGPVEELKREYFGKATKFAGYESFVCKDAKVLALIQNNQRVTEAQPGDALVFARPDLLLRRKRWDRPATRAGWI